jgi:lipoprotein-releasing system permease protein
MVLIGALRSIWAKEFSWRAFLAQFVTASVGLAVVVSVAFAGEASLPPDNEFKLWGGTLLVAFVSGSLGGKLGRRVGFWESYLTWLIIVVVVWVECLLGWSRVLGLGPGESESYFRFMYGGMPGRQYIGDMWDRMVAICAGASFLLAIFGGSSAFLLFGARGEFDSSMGFEWLVSSRHLGGNGKFVSSTGLVAVLGIALGVAALISVTAVMSGYEQDVQSKILSTNPHFVVQKYGIDFTEYDMIAERVRKLEDVVASTPFVFNEALLGSNDLAVGVLFKGVEGETAGSVTRVESNLCADISEEGRCVSYEKSKGQLSKLLKSDDGVPSLLLGIDLYKKLGKPLGRMVTLTTPVGIAGARGNAPKRSRFRVRGIFRSGMYEFDSRLMYMSVAAAQDFLGLGEAVSGVEFKIQDPNRVEFVTKRALLAAGRHPYKTLDWRELNASIFTALKLQKIVMFLVLTFIVIVAAFNIASSLFMTVAEKSAEIGVMKSMGARDGSIMKIFVFEGWMVGGAGTVLGLILGLTLCLLLSQLEIRIAADVYMVESLRVLVRPVEIFATVVAALVVSHLATLYPALQAARQRPVDAMRYE